MGIWFLKICNEWGITTNNITAIVTDNGANIVKAVIQSFGSGKHLPCFAHTLNLVAMQVIDGNEEIKTLCEKVKTLIAFFKHSVAATDELRKFENLKLIQSVATRWNSTYYMLEHFITLSERIGSILLKYPKAPSMLSASDLQLAKEIVLVLRPLEVTTKEICGETYITASKIIPLINCLNNNIEAFDSILITDASKRLKDSLLNNMIKRFHQIEFVTSLAIATILDPRFKRLHFNNAMAYSQALHKISRMMDVKSQEIVQNVRNKQSEEKIICHLLIYGHIIINCLTQFG